MNYILGILLIASPSLLVVAIPWVMRAYPGRATTIQWLIVATCWAIAVWSWVDYGRQTDDVGLIVSGVLSWAASIAAAAATVASIVSARLRAGD